MRYILALDAGTTSVRAIIFDHDGQIRAVAQKEIRQIFPQPGWVEHDPQEIWRTQIAVAIEALDRARVKPRDVVGAGIANQRETSIVWDRETGHPVYNAIVWQDRRTAGMCDELRAAGHDGTIQKLTGLILDPYFSATKIAWILDNVPDARTQAEAGKLICGTVETWLIWKLTSGKVHVTDVSNASRTMLFNLHTSAWDKDLLKLFRIPESMLPEVRSSSEVYGAINAVPGLAHIAVAGAAGDQQAALFGQLCVQPGLAKNTYGTGCFLLQNIGAKPVASKQRLLTTAAWKIGEKQEFALEGGVFIGGAIVQWLRDGLQLVRSAQEADMLAASVPDSGGVVLVPAFTGLGAPHWDPYARGLIIGLTRDTRAAHIARAALEGVAFQVADLIDAMHADTGKPFTELRVDGGASRSEPMMQFQADLLGVPVVRPAVVETTALGAAYFAGLAVGFWQNTASIAAHWQVERVFEPKMPRARVTELRGRWNEALGRAKNWEPKEKTLHPKKRKNNRYEK
ncbi:glycerol kinase GlpK [Nitrosospira sp. Nsp13]|uniref:glycerol kinase GlpK n=1 Tax=Nitrosospira sp. Nsp13 TaxID=1855332 RepID=UPI000884A11E|nr:glycerol kinase GlpK [Nitrosospira sp. Nsp13]SCY03251.1 glycerol kinase [Nitrosospira sp. Nsp13]